MHFAGNIEIFTPIGYWLRSGCESAVEGQCHHRCTPAKSRRGGFSSHFSPPRSRTYSRTDRTDGPDAGIPSLSGRPRLAGSSLPRLPLRLKRKLPTAPGRSFGCGGAIKNSPVSGAWIADGTDGHVALVGLPIASPAPLSTARDVRSFIYSFAVRLLGLSSRLRPIGVHICISKFVNCRAFSRDLQHAPPFGGEGILYLHEKIAFAFVIVRDALFIPHMIYPD